MVVAAYVEEFTGKLSAAIRMLFDWLVVGQVLPFQPGELGAGPEACREEGQDAGALRGGGEGAPGRDRPLVARWPA